MSLHGRYIDGSESPRAQIKFRRIDLLYRTSEILKHPVGTMEIHGLPIYPPEKKGEVAVGPTLLDMLTRKIVAVKNDEGKLEDRPVWQLRPLASLWPNPAQPRRPRLEVVEHHKAADHPFNPAMVSGGRRSLPVVSSSARSLAEETVTMLA